ncbi:MAG: four helix bundle protein [Bacteroidales bacterium]|nr:four helix bundle protein [Bacteroidales bacterium]
MAYKEFTEMPVWKKAFELLLKVYDVTKTYPKEEKYGLVSDMRRAANSVTNNISEGFGRYERRDKTRFYKISRGSCYELMNQSITSQALGFMADKDRNFLLDGYREVIVDLDQMIRAIENTIRK